MGNKNCHKRLINDIQVSREPANCKDTSSAAKRAVARHASPKFYSRFTVPGILSLFSNVESMSWYYLTLTYKLSTLAQPEERPRVGEIWLPPRTRCAKPTSSAAARSWPPAPSGRGRREALDLVRLSCYIGVLNTYLGIKIHEHRKYEGFWVPRLYHINCILNCLG